MLHGNVADVYNILSCVKNFTGVNVTALIRTARFLQKFIASESSVCLLFAANAACQLNQIILVLM